MHSEYKSKRGTFVGCIALGLQIRASSFSFMRTVFIRFYSIWLFGSLGFIIRVFLFVVLLFGSLGFMTCSISLGFIIRVFCLFSHTRIINPSEQCVFVRCITLGLQIRARGGRITFGLQIRMSRVQRSMH